MIPLKKFGRTGHNSTRTIFGAAALWAVSQDEADRTLETLLKAGINHIDTAASYGESEMRIGPWMREHRKNFFLATKTGERSYQGAREELYQSLDRLKVDSVDLWQMHVLVKEEEWQKALSPGGAIDAFIEAREQGLTRFLGVTGHGLAAPAMHKRSLSAFEFDSVLLPYNFSLIQNPQYANDFKELVNLCAGKNVAIQTIKAIARGQLGDKKAQYNVWYDPLVDDIAIDHAVKWVLANEQVFLNTAGDIDLLKKVLQTAQGFDGQKPDDHIMMTDMQQYGITPLFTEEFSNL